MMHVERRQGSAIRPRTALFNIDPSFHLVARLLMLYLLLLLHEINLMLLLESRQ